MMLKIFKLVVILLVPGSTLLAQGTHHVEIQPTHPKPGDTVKVVLEHSSTLAEATQVDDVYLNFTYSNYYEFPRQIKMDRINDHWVTKFVIPPYGKYASFTISDGRGKSILQPSDTSHYELFVYDQQGQPTEGNYVAKAYSLGVQNRASPYRIAQQQAYFQKELDHFPDNYEANLQILAFEMKSTNKETVRKARQKALDIIHQRYDENPTVSGNLNQVTKGFLIVGENQRVDSIRQVVIRDHPTSNLGISYRMYSILDLEDQNAILDSINHLFQFHTDENASAFGSAYSFLFKHAMENKDEENAIKYFSLINQPSDNPYQWRTFNDYVDLMIENDLMIEQADALTSTILENIEDYPVTLIRYFPETGYLISHDEGRQRKIDYVRAEMMAKKALLKHKQGCRAEASDLLMQAYGDLQDKDIMIQAAQLFGSLGDQKRALELLDRTYLQFPFDPTVRELITEYLPLLPTSVDHNEYFSQLDQTWHALLFDDLKEKELDIDFPAEFSIVNMKNEVVHRDSLAGKIVIIDLWATWCVPCLESFPYVQRIYDRYKDRDDVLFMVLNTGSGNTFEDAANWQKSNAQYSFPVYYSDQRKLITDLDVTSIPTTFLLDKSNKIRFKKVGFNGEDMLKELDGMIQYLLFY